MTANPAPSGHATSLKSPCGATSKPKVVAVAGHGNVGVGPSHVAVAPLSLTWKMPYDTLRYGRLVYVFDAEMGPPTLNSCTRCEFELVPGGAQSVCEGAQPPANEKVQVLPASPAGKGIERSELVSCWMPTWVVCMRWLVSGGGGVGGDTNSEDVDIAFDRAFVRREDVDCESRVVVGDGAGLEWGSWDRGGGSNTEQCEGSGDKCEFHSEGVWKTVGGIEEIL